MSELQKYWLYAESYRLRLVEKADNKCGNYYRCKDVDTARAQDKAAIADLQERLARSEAAIRWALGEEGDFPGEHPGKGRYHWRTELRARAGLAAADRKQPCDQCDDPECPVNQRDGGEA